MYVTITRRRNGIRYFGSPCKSRKYKINMKMFLKLLFKFTFLQFQIRTGAMKRPPCSNFALLNDHFQFLWSFNVNLYSKTGVYRGIHYFLFFAVNHILWVLVRTASTVLTCTHNICFEQKYENSKTIN